MNIIDIADVGANQNKIAFVPLKVNKKVSWLFHTNIYIYICFSNFIAHSFFKYLNPSTLLLVFQISFVHKTYYILIIVEDLITSVLRTFSYNDLDLSVRPVLCFLYQVNAKLQCKKIKKNKRWIDFQRSGACKVKDDIKDRNLDGLYPKELQSLIHAKSAAAILKETLEFWKNCVVENRRNRLMVARKCQKNNPKMAYMDNIFKMGIKGEWEFKIKL